MSDLLNANLANIYKFIAENGGVEAIDENNNGLIAKEELVSFLGSFQWDGLSSTDNKGDLITEFFRMFNISGKTGDITINNRKYTNSGNLDQDEQVKLKLEVAKHEIINEIVSNITDMPGNLADPTGWKKSVTASLEDKVNAWLADPANADKTDLTVDANKQALKAYLNEALPAIKNMTTANDYAQQYIKNDSKLSQLSEYKCADDTAWNSILRTYIRSLTGNETQAEIKAQVQELFDAYLYTAGLRTEEECPFSLASEPYNYPSSNDDNMNDLQKAVLQRDLQRALTSGDMKKTYEANKEAIDQAIVKYFESLKFGDFQRVNEDVLQDFLNSKAYDMVENVIAINNILTGEALYENVSEKLGKSLADIIKNDGKYLNVMKEIKAEVITKAENGDFNDANGVLDEAKVLEFIMERIEARIAEFYPDGFKSMGLTELRTMYNKLADNADKMPDTEESLAAHREAAIQYCNALAEKSDKFVELIQYVFGNNYVTEINKLYPSEIRAKIDELEAKALELGDANDLVLTEESWSDFPLAKDGINLEASRKTAIEKVDAYMATVEAEYQRTLAKGLFFTTAANAIKAAATAEIKGIFGSEDYKTAINKMTADELIKAMDSLKQVANFEWEPTELTNGNRTSSLSMIQGDSKIFNIAPSFTDRDGNAKTITSDRITYKSSNTSIATVDKNGEVTIKGNTKGTYTVILSVMVDGVEVSTNEVTVKIATKADPATAVKKVSGWGGYETEHCETWGVNNDRQVHESDFAELYNSDAKIILHVSMDKLGNSWSDVKDLVSERLTMVGTAIVNALSTTGLDKTVLTQALDAVKTKYVSAGVKSNDNTKGSSKTALKNNAMNYMNDNRNDTKSRIVCGIDSDGKNSYVYMIHFKDLVDDICAKYNELITK